MLVFNYFNFMKNKIQIVQLIIILLVVITGCNLKKTKHQSIQLGTETDFIIIADTIINDVVIKNPDNDEWTDFCLRKMDKKTLVNEIFDLVYNEKLTAFEFFQNKPLSIEDIKALENNSEFSRDKIAKVQFEEAWYFDPINQKMIKKVHSIMLAYEIYNNLGEIRGYKPAFKVYLN